jgi:predicted TIM-barrel fold metal-dependent hydrolase
MKSPIPIFDCHAHVGVHPDFPACKYTVEEMLQVMDLLNIEVMAITSTLACYNDCPRGNEEVADVLRRFPQRFRGYVTVNPNPPGEALRELQRWSHIHRPPLIKLHPECHKYPVGGEHYRPVWEFAHETGAVVLVHTWDSDSNCGPLLLGPIASEFAHARILIGHSGVTWRGYMQALQVAAETPNTFLDITGSQSHRTIIEHAVARVGADRILFGTDMPFLEAAMPLGRVLTARISHTDREKILRTNFLRLIEEES